MKAANMRGDQEKIIALSPRRKPEAIRPIYVRLPSPGLRCPWTRLSRSGLADICVASKKNDWRPPVKSFRVRRKGDKRAVRLIVFESLMAYLRQFMTPIFIGHAALSCGALSEEFL
jgi:hypothetical protein